MHTVLEVIAAVVIFSSALALSNYWELCGGAERSRQLLARMAVRPVRIINHGTYPAIAAFTARLMTGMLTGPRGVASIAWVGVLIRWERD
jgi:hypothetical protein